MDLHQGDADKKSLAISHRQIMMHSQEQFKIAPIFTISKQSDNDCSSNYNPMTNQNS